MVSPVPQNSPRPRPRRMWPGPDPARKVPVRTSPLRWRLAIIRNVAALGQVHLLNRRWAKAELCLNLVEKADGLRAYSLASGRGCPSRMTVTELDDVIDLYARAQRIVMKTDAQVAMDTAVERMLADAARDG